MFLGGHRGVPAPCESSNTQKKTKGKPQDFPFAYCPYFEHVRRWLFHCSGSVGRLQLFDAQPIRTAHAVKGCACVSLRHPGPLCVLDRRFIRVGCHRGLVAAYQEVTPVPRQGWRIRHSRPICGESRNERCTHEALPNISGSASCQHCERAIGTYRSNHSLG